MSDTVCRTVTLIVINEAGEPLGQLPAFDVTVPFWPETAEIVATARDRFGLDVAVLRLLHATGEPPAGGHVTYLAQLLSPADAAALAPTDVDLSPHPLRAPYARPGGPAESLAWATAVLDERGRGPVTAMTQQRTWNLSTLWRLDTATGPVLAQAGAPVLRPRARGAGLGVGQRPGHPAAGGQDARMLLAHVDGEDLYGAPAEVRRKIAADAHYLQLAAIDSVEHLLAAGVPDRRSAQLVGYLTGVVDAYGGDDPALRALVDGLPDRLARVAACGLPDTLVHGDLHPGNVIGTEDRRTIIDWGDSFIGQPALDILRLVVGLDPAEAARGDRGVGRALAGGAARQRPGYERRAAAPRRGAAPGGGVRRLPGRHRAVRAPVPRR